MKRTDECGGHTYSEIVLPTPLVRPHQTIPARDSGVLHQLRAWPAPRSRYTVATLLIGQHAQRAEDHATAEMAYAHTTGDGDAYNSWWAIRDAIAELQASPGNVAS